MGIDPNRFEFYGDEDIVLKKPEAVEWLRRMGKRADRLLFFVDKQDGKLRFLKDPEHVEEWDGSNWLPLPHPYSPGELASLEEVRRGLEGMDIADLGDAEHDAYDQVQRELEWLSPTRWGHLNVNDVSFWDETLAECLDLVKKIREAGFATARDLDFLDDSKNLVEAWWINDAAYDFETENLTLRNKAANAAHALGDLLGLNDGEFLGDTLKAEEEAGLAFARELAKNDSEISFLLRDRQKAWDRMWKEGPHMWGEFEKADAALRLAVQHAQRKRKPS